MNTKKFKLKEGKHMKEEKNLTTLISNLIKEIDVLKKRVAELEQKKG